MPYLPDEEDEKALALGGGGGGGPSMRSAGGQAAPAPARESGGGFVNLQRVLGLNQAGAQSMAGGMLGASEALQRNANDTAAGARASGYASALTSQGGREAAARGLYGPRETAGDAGFDAFLSGQAGGNRFNQGAQQASELERIIGQPAPGPRFEPEMDPGIGIDLNERSIQARGKGAKLGNAREGGKTWRNQRFEGY